MLATCLADIPVSVGDVITLDSYVGTGLKDGETELPEDPKPSSSIYPSRLFGHTLR